MRAIVCLVLLAAAWLSSKAADQPSPGKETFRVIHLHVLQPDGKPAVHRDVELHGFDRRALGPVMFLGNEPGDTERARKSGWLFTTDDHGDVTVRIWNLAGWEDKAGRPGWGTYILVVPPGPDNAGGVSQRFWTYNDVDSKNLWWNGGEWGNPMPLPPAGLHLAMALQNGYTLYGRLVDDRDHRTPLPGVKVHTANDLHVDTHTGYGGAIFQKSATTDANGEFKIEHLFYAPLYLDIEGLWMETEGRNGWQPQRKRVLDPPLGNGERINFGVVVHSTYHYTGTITDSQGQPVAGVDVFAGISSQPEPMTWGDEHHFEHSTTDAQGHFDLPASTPWARFIAAEDKTHGRVDYAKSWDDADPPLAPGKYDMQFGTTPKH